MENSSDREQDGKDKSVKSSSLIGSLMPRILKEAQEKRGFVIIALTKEAHMSLSRIAKLAIRLMEGDPKMEGIPWTLLAYF
ncbi:hypothetical protein Tco_1386860 [Tanacetum coccineum]